MLELIQGDPCEILQQTISNFIEEYCNNVTFSVFTNSSLNLSLANALNYMSTVLRLEASSQNETDMLSKDYPI